MDPWRETVTASRAVAPDQVTQKPFWATHRAMLAIAQCPGMDRQYQGGITMHLGTDMATGYVEDTESDSFASEELAVDAPALTRPAPDPHPQPAVIAG
jgi:hypothetical protein